MDTRTKILTLDAVLERVREKQVVWVTGTFDPLTAEHVRRLLDLSVPEHVTVAVVVNSADPLLPLEARAQLVAALSMVDYVIAKNGPVRETDADSAELTRAFVDLVARRHRGDQA